MSLADRMDSLARQIARRESAHAGDLETARARAEALHARVAEAIDRFNAVAAREMPHLRVELTPTRVDDKHLHSVEFDLARGRHRAVVIVKSKGEVTLVGPFRAGKNEGPCRSFPLGEGADTGELDDALGDFLERFVEEAATP